MYAMLQEENENFGFVIRPARVSLDEFFCMSYVCRMSYVCHMSN